MIMIECRCLVPCMTCMTVELPKGFFVCLLLGFIMDIGTIFVFISSSSRGMRNLSLF